MRISWCCEMLEGGFDVFRFVFLIVIFLNDINVFIEILDYN